SLHFFSHSCSNCAHSGANSSFCSGHPRSHFISGGCFSSNTGRCMAEGPCRCNSFSLLRRAKFSFLRCCAFSPSCDWLNPSQYAIFFDDPPCAAKRVLSSLVLCILRLRSE